jgi:hypothetical protein
MPGAAQHVQQQHLRINARQAGLLGLTEGLGGGGVLQNL